MSNLINPKNTYVGNINMSNINVSAKTNEDIENEYFKKLKEDYGTLQIKKNKVNIVQKDRTMISISPDLIKKASKDKTVDVKLRKLLDDAVENKASFRSYKYSKDGHEVSSVSFMIDSKLNVSCKIRLKKKISIDTKEERKSIATKIEKQVEEFKLKNKSNNKAALYYNYISVIAENKFTSLDYTV